MPHSPQHRFSYHDGHDPARDRAGARLLVLLILAPWIALGVLAWWWFA
jgi:hypothetical protein